ncbi:YceH family protein [Marinomonas sp. 2405UD68-3]|uniref:YceH family protein n=1 Tax=Marinomonas sp. 2405UD68-3 TaxID=3391835 RepID=UPI0039C9B5FB
MSQLSLSNEQIRIIGSLIEKSITTPDLYPLSLKSLQNACNQKSNREPITEFTLTEVESILNTLIGNNFVIDTSSFNSKTPKYQHRFCNTEFSDIQLKDSELAVICLLMLRGPQTSGELRSRSSRLYPFKDLSEVEETLLSLQHISGGPYITALPKVPGKREIRYIQLFGKADTSITHHSSLIVTHEPRSEIDALKQKITELENQIYKLQEQLENQHSQQPYK